MKHNTRNTVSVAAPCRKCGRVTQHRNDGVKTGPCLECIDKLETEHTEKKENPQRGFSFE